TNSGLCALAFTIHMTLLGEAGFTRLAALNHAAAVHAAEQLEHVAGVTLLTDSFFNEFTIRLPRPAAPVGDRLARSGPLGGGPARHRRRRPGVAAFTRPAGARRPAAGRGHRAHQRRRYPGAHRRIAGGLAMNRDPITGTFSGNRGLQVEEKLIFEQDMHGRTG